MEYISFNILTDQVSNIVIEKLAFQKEDVMCVTTPITKYNFQVKKLSDLPRIIKEAFHIATTGRPGPVVVDIPKDVSEASSVEEFNRDFFLPGYQATTKPNTLQIMKLADALGNAQKPAILTGGGIIFSDASQELQDMAEM